MLSSNLKSRLTGIIFAAPIIVFVYIAALNLYLGPDISKYISLSDYISIVTHRSMEFMAHIALVFFYVYVASRILALPGISLKGRIVIVVLSLLSTTASFIFMSIMEAHPQLPNFFSGEAFVTQKNKWYVMLLFITSCTGYLVYRFYTAEPTQKIYGIHLLDDKFDAFIMTLFMVIAFLDPISVGDEILSTKGYSVVRSCVNEAGETTAMHLPLEKGLLIKRDNDIVLISYDCLKDVQTSIIGVK